MADVTLNLETTNVKELTGQGIRAYVLQDYETAVRALSKASELLVTEHGSETHNSLGDVYLYYGKALLDLWRKESDPLVDGALKTVEEESEEEEEGGESGGEENKTEAEAEAETNGEEKEEPSKPVEASEAQASATETKPEESEETKEEPEGSGVQPEEELTDLQVAWEVLELAKTIFKARGDEGRKNLAETLVVLGEISLESGNFSPAIEDMLEGLEMQKSLFKNDSRTVAETLFKLGGAYSTNGQIDEAIVNFNKSYECLKNIIANLEKDEEHKKDNVEELEELKSLIPEIEEKIADMKNLKVELAQKKESGSEETSKTNGNAEASSSKQVNDISHLVKRKRKDDEPQEENPAKKPSP